MTFQFQNEWNPILSDISDSIVDRTAAQWTPAMYWGLLEADARAVRPVQQYVCNGPCCSTLWVGPVPGYVITQFVPPVTYPDPYRVVAAPGCAPGSEWCEPPTVSAPPPPSQFSDEPSSPELAPTVPKIGIREAPVAKVSSPTSPRPIITESSRVSPTKEKWGRKRAPKKTRNEPTWIPQILKRGMSLSSLLPAAARGQRSAVRRRVTFTNSKDVIYYDKHSAPVMIQGDTVYTEKTFSDK
ncbi:ORF45 [Ictalurid herpesvirus 1]|nr:ORF45 [Ictalurid herpesvirus 1]